MLPFNLFSCVKLPHLPTINYLHWISRNRMEIFLEMIQIIIMSGLGRYRSEDKVEDNYCVCVCVCV